MGIARIVVALLVFSAIVIFHELGHFLLAKKNGVKVIEFSIGMGPRIVSYPGKETRYSIKAFPVGGSCQMLGEDELCNDPSAFVQKGVWARISTVAAGPVFNFILAFVLALFVIGAAGVDRPYVAKLPTGFPAAEAGLKKGDLITGINGHKMDISREVDVYFQFHPLEDGQGIEVTYEREGTEQTAIVTPVPYENYIIGVSRSADQSAARLAQISKGGPAEKAGLKKGDKIVAINGSAIKTGEEFAKYLREHSIGKESLTIQYEREGKIASTVLTPLATASLTIGLSYNEARGGRVTNPFTVVKYSFVEMKFWIKTVVASLGQLITGKISTNNIAGPLGMFGMIGDSYEQAASIGVGYALLQIAYLIILLSANLGVMNLLPIPGLDGGRLVFLLIEVIRGKRVNPEKEGFVHMIGFIALMLLMAFVFYNDMMRLLH